MANWAERRSALPPLQYRYGQPGQTPFGPTPLCNTAMANWAERRSALPPLHHRHVQPGRTPFGPTPFAIPPWPTGPSAARPYAVQVIGEAVGAVALAVLLDFGDHAPQRLGLDAFLSGDFFVHLPQAVSGQPRASDYTPSQGVKAATGRGRNTGCPACPVRRRGLEGPAYAKAPAGRAGTGRACLRQGFGKRHRD
jgi:hypothetical protein